jgi:hypothetical protein
MEMIKLSNARNQLALIDELTTHYSTVDPPELDGAAVVGLGDAARRALEEIVEVLDRAEIEGDVEADPARAA